MSDRRVKNINYGTTAIITARFSEYSNSTLTEPNSFEVVLKKGSTTVATWDSVSDADKIVSVEEDGVFQYYQVFIDTTIFTEPCEGIITMSGEFLTSPPQTIVGKVKLIMS